MSQLRVQVGGSTRQFNLKFKVKGSKILNVKGSAKEQQGTNHKNRQETRKKKITFRPRNISEKICFESFRVGRAVAE